MKGELLITHYAAGADLLFCYDGATKWHEIARCHHVRDNTATMVSLNHKWPYKIGGFPKLFTLNGKQPDEVCRLLAQVYELQWLVKDPYFEVTVKEEQQ